jgi:putative transcriptional regulator
MLYNHLMLFLKNSVRRFRFERNEMSQAELAKALDLSRQTIVAIEAGNYNPSIFLALKLAAFFGCAMEELFYLEEKHEE